MHNDTTRWPNSASGEPESARLPGRPPPGGAPTLLPGTQVGDLRIERVLGQGGYGVVYLAHDPALNRHVALKEYWPQALAQRTDGNRVALRSPADAHGFRLGLEAFMDEARLLARFDHPSLVRVHRYWEQHDTAYMSMSWVDGPTLQDLRTSLRRPPDEAWLRDHLLLPLLDVLEMMHAASCLHRDISPTNILMAGGQRPVLLDLGAARRVQVDMTQPLTAVLNPAYAPLEQFADSTDVPQGPWTDIYSLAAVVLFAITGEAPTSAPLRAAQLSLPASRIVRDCTAPHLGLNYSDAFLAALDAAYAVVPTQRMASARAWREALQKKAAPASAAFTATAANAGFTDTQPAGAGVTDTQPGSGPDAAMRRASAPAPSAADEPEGYPDDEPVDEEVRRAIHAAVHTWQFPAGAEAPPGAASGMGASGLGGHRSATDAGRAMRRDPELDTRPGDDEGTLPPTADASVHRGTEPRRAPATARGLLLPSVVVACLFAAVAFIGWEVYSRGADENRVGSLATPRLPVPAANGSADPDTSGDGASDRAPAGAQAGAAPGAASASPGVGATPSVAAPARGSATPLPTGDTAGVPSPGASRPESAVATVTPSSPAPSTPAPASVPVPPVASPAAPVAERRAAAPAPAPRPPASPREACGARTNFSLYYCMQKQCEQARNRSHAQCVLLRERDIVAD